MTHRISEARALDGCRLFVRFHDGTAGELDLGDLAGRGVFKQWLIPEHFRSVSISDRGSLEWPGGLDLCPDALYLRLTGKSFEAVFAGERSEPRHA